MKKSEWQKVVIRLHPDLHKKLRVLVALRGTSVDAVVGDLVGKWIQEASRHAVEEVSALLGASADSWQTTEEPEAPADKPAVFHVEPDQEATDAPSAPRLKPSRRRKVGMLA